MTRARRSLLALLVLLLAGCSLPLEDGVQVPGSSTGDEQLLGADQGGVAPLPAGPQPGATPVNVLNGFLDAQVSSEDDHAIARQFLAPEIRDAWNDDAQVKVYDPASLVRERLGDPDGDTTQIRLRGTATDTISGDGSLDPEDSEIDETYTVRRDAAGEWRLTDVPEGLRLTAEDVEDSYSTRLVYYLARGSGPDRHLVPDPALLLDEDEPAAGLVRRLVAGPSTSLTGAVDNAIPESADVLSVTTDAAGLVTVDLSPEVAALPGEQLQWLSAQLVWTLRGAGSAFVELRLLAGGQPVEVPGVEDEVQDRTLWEDYDPDGLSERVTTYYLVDRRLRALESETRLPTGVGVPVDRAAVSPRTDELAVLTDVGAGWEVRLGSRNGPLPDRALYTGTALSSPSWGSGRRGLWLLQSGPDPQVLLLDRSGEALPVPVPDPPPGRLTALRVSRDGARIALVSGDDEASRVYVAQVIDDTGGLRIGPAREIGFGVTDVLDISWESATTVVALGTFEGPAPLPLRLTVAGSGAVERVGLPGLEQVVPQSLAAAPDRPLVVAATDQGSSVLLASSAGVFQRVGAAGTTPFYPG